MVFRRSSRARAKNDVSISSALESGKDRKFTSSA
jgi:hypothetical protein